MLYQFVTYGFSMLNPSGLLAVHEGKSGARHGRTARCESLKRALPILAYTQVLVCPQRELRKTVRSKALDDIKRVRYLTPSSHHAFVFLALRVPVLGVPVVITDACS